MITICENCFPDYGDHEVYSMVPLGPCDECGTYDQRSKGGIRVYLFPSDPRELKGTCGEDHAIDTKTI